jgi:hypothetical protein
MSQYLIHIKDILGNKQYIYNTHINEFGFENSINFILSQENKKDLKYKIHDQYCEIYYDQEICNKGWIWTSNEIKTNVIYILTRIPILNTTKPNKTIQTNHLGTVSSVTQTSDRDNIELIEIDSCLQSRSPDWQGNRTLVRQGDRSLVRQDPIINAWPHLVNEINKLSLGDGYANNPFIPMWSEEINTELKEKLSIPNYGLKSTCSSSNLQDYL